MHILKITLKKNATFLCDIVFVDEKFHKKIAKSSLNMLEIFKFLFFLEPRGKGHLYSLTALTESLGQEFYS